MKPANELKPGDTFHRDGTLVTVLTEKEPCSDQFGQDLFRFTCRREDTGETGYCTFGQLGVVQV